MARNALCSTTAFDFNKYINDVSSRPTVIMTQAQLQELITKNEYEQIEEEEIEIALEDLDFEYVEFSELDALEF